MIGRADTQRRGFTLIEMLAVVILLGLISSVAVVSLARADHAAALQSARWGFANLAAQARLAARTEGSAVIIRPNDSGSHLSAGLAFPVEKGWSASLDLPRDVTIRVLDAHANRTGPLGRLLIDRTGRSVDVIITIESGTAGGERWFMHGLTGHLTRQSVEGEDR